MAQRRVAVTGLGVVSCLGRGKESFWSALLERRSGLAPVRAFPTEGMRSRLGGELSWTGPRGGRLYTAQAVREALADAGLDPSAVDPARCGAVLGTTQGEVLETEAVLSRRVAGGSDADLFREAFPSFPGCLSAAVGRELGWRGPNATLTTACAAGNFALAYGFDRVAGGGADLMLAGGVDVLNRTNYAGFNRLQALAPDRCSPFSLGRQGIVPAEGCAVLVLEELAAALRRGARVYAELLGYGVSCDARHVTAPDADGVARALRECLQACGVEPEDVDYISAHGTGTPANDRTETAAVKQVFGGRAGMIPVSSIKALAGHAMGAAAAFEAAACCLALESGVIPPTANFTPGDPDCDLDYVSEGPRRTDLRVVLSNGFAFGGSNAVIALAKPGWREERKLPWKPEPRELVITGLARVDDAEPLALAERLLPDKDLRFLDRRMALTLAASVLALQDAGFSPEAVPGETGIALDSSGELESQLAYHRDLLSGGPAGVQPMMFPAILANAAASRAAVVLGLKLVNLSLAGSFPGGESALVCACELLRRRGRGMICAGGVWTAPGPAPAGIADIPEAGVMLVVETGQGARARGARILARVADCQEGFDPDGQCKPTSTDALWKAIKSVSRGGKTVGHAATGLWGGKIAISLVPA